MILKKNFLVVFFLCLAMGIGGQIFAQELSLRDYNVVVGKDIEVPSGSD